MPDTFAFSPIKIGRRHLWQCETCYALLTSQNNGIEGHIKWHEQITATIKRASIGF